MTNTVLKIHLDESGYFGGHWFDSGGEHFVPDTKRIRTAVGRSTSAEILDEFVPSGDLPIVQVGKLDARVLDAEELTGALTHDQTVASLVGDGLSVQNNRLTASESAVSLSDGGVEVLPGPSDINFTEAAGATVSVSDDGDGTATVEVSATDTRTGVSENGTEVLGSTSDINFTGDDGVTVDATDDGDGTATVDIGGPYEVVEVSGSHTASAGEFVWADTTGGGFPVELPPPAVGRRVAVKKFDASGNTLSVTTPGSASVDGQTSIDIVEDWYALTLISNGTDWAKH